MGIGNKVASTERRYIYIESEQKSKIVSTSPSIRDGTKSPRPKYSTKVAKGTAALTQPSNDQEVHGKITRTHCR